MNELADANFPPMTMKWIQTEANAVRAKNGRRCTDYRWPGAHEDCA
jgi:hypothetical protein